jgi:hypothetical protein
MAFGHSQSSSINYNCHNHAHEKETSQLLAGWLTVSLRRIKYAALASQDLLRKILQELKFTTKSRQSHIQCYPAMLWSHIWMKVLQILFTVYQYPLPLLSQQVRTGMLSRRLTVRERASYFGMVNPPSNLQFIFLFHPISVQISQVMYNHILICDSCYPFPGTQ